MTPERKNKIYLVTGLIAMAFAATALVSSVSYCFTWQADQSLAGATLSEQSEDVLNSGGPVGFRLGRFLVGQSFGLAAFVLIGFFAVLAVKLFFRRDNFRILDASVLTLTGTFLLSMTLACLSPLLSLQNAFGGSLGGECGMFVVEWMQSMFGVILTWVFLLLLIVLWLIFASRRFFTWVTSVRPVHRVKEAAPSPQYGGTSEVPSPEDDVEEDEEYDDEVPEAETPEEPVRKEEVKVPDIPAPPSEPEERNADEGMEVIKDDSLNGPVREELTRLDMRDELPDYVFPPLDLLGNYDSSRREVSSEELERNNNKIRATLANYKIQVSEVKAVVGPTVTLYKVKPAPGVKIAAIKNLQEDIAMQLNARGVRVVPLSDSVGIEVANDQSSIVPLKALLNDASFRESKAELPIAIGYTITQKVKVFDLADAPHLLVAGATKQGKSVGLNVIVASLLYSRHPSELKFVFIDPKMVEFSLYAKLLKHYLAVLPGAVSEEDEKNRAIVKNPKLAGEILKSLCVEMDKRYELLSLAGVNNIKLYNEKYKDRHLLPTEGHRFLPYLVVVIDEYADLTMSVGAGPESKALARGITTSVIRLAQKGRAAGLHVILATQRPTVDVVTGLIKTNFPMRIAFRVTSGVDSSTILGAPGAEKLIGNGDMLISSGVEMERVQCGYISNDEIRAITQFIGSQNTYRKCYNIPYYLPEAEPESGDDGGGMIDMKNIDERFEEAARMVVVSQKGSTSDLQRHLGMGYAKAGRVMDQLQAAGIVGPQSGTKPREVLIKDLNELEELLKHYLNDRS